LKLLVFGVGCGGGLVASAVTELGASIIVFVFFDADKGGQLLRSLFEEKNLFVLVFDDLEKFALKLLSICALVFCFSEFFV
jgi:hypothetical protein